MTQFYHFRMNLDSKKKKKKYAIYLYISKVLKFFELVD